MDTFHMEPFRFALSRKETSRPLWRPELELVFVLQGTGRVYFSDLKTAYTLHENDLFAVNSFEVQDFELDAGSAALSFFVSPGFLGTVAPELLQYRVSCRSFLYLKDKQSAFDVAQAFRPFTNRRAAPAAVPPAAPPRSWRT